VVCVPVGGGDGRFVHRASVSQHRPPAPTLSEAPQRDTFVAVGCLVSVPGEIAFGDEVTVVE